jgi:hypothetical protein
MAQQIFDTLELSDIQEVKLSLWLEHNAGKYRIWTMDRVNGGKITFTTVRLATNPVRNISTLDCYDELGLVNGFTATVMGNKVITSSELEGRIISADDSKFWYLIDLRVSGGFTVSVHRTDWENACRK